MQQPVETATAAMWIDDEGILHIVAHAGIDEDLASAERNVVICRGLAGEEKRLMLCDISRMRSMSRAARVLYSGPKAAEYTSACALLIGSAVSRMIGNFFLGLNRNPMPTRLFTSESEAIAWLRMHKRTS